MNFHFSNSTEKHFQRHLHGSKMAGGTFLPFINDLSALIACIPDSAITLKKEQGRMRSCFVFEYKEVIGELGILNRNEIKAIEIKTEFRDGQIISYIECNALPQTRLFTIVAQWQKGQWQIITAYPGGYSLPFPRRGMERELYDASKTYWRNYILVKSEKCTVQSK
jgi:hypothetical protein